MAADGGKETGYSLSERLPFYVVVQLVSVLLPGAGVLTEVTLLLIHYARHPGTDLGFLIDSLSGIRGAGIVLFATVGVSGAFVLGYLSRELAFVVLGRFERLHDWWVAFGVRRFHRNPERAIGWKEVRTLVGDDAAASLVELHPVLALLSGDRVPQDLQPTVGGGHRADVSFEVFTYTKLWLRGRPAAFRLDFLELEINVLTGLPIPVLLFAADIVVLGDEPALIRIAALPIGLLICAAILRSARRLRRTERWEAIRNLAFEDTIRRAEVKRAAGESR
ncbi:MAG: hypothetical protein QOI78_6663, partial [Actinomycetota bacterium]|nr:hypothetical protein [Actinomycetota bacterium]